MKQTAAPRRWASPPELRRFADRLLASDPGLQRLRSATRVTLAAAAGLALAAGEVLSPERLYWVVIIVFIVFAGSGTLGDTLVRSIQRAALPPAHQSHAR